METKTPPAIMLLSSIIIYPWLLYLFTLHGLDKSSDIALSGIVIYLCIWLISLLICAICTANLSTKWIFGVTFGTLSFGTLWVLIEWGLKPLSLCMSVLIAALVWRLWQTPRSIFRWCIFSLITISLTITLIHHNAIVYGFYSQENLRIEAIVKSAVHQTQLDWTNAPCVYKGWNLDKCLRFPAGYEGKAVTHPNIKPHIDNMRLNWKNDRVIQYKSIQLDSCHWGISFDGKYWQITYLDNHYFQQVILPLIIFEWYFAIVLWGTMIFMTFNWHTKKSSTQRYQQGNRIGVLYTGLLIMHCGHLWLIRYLLTLYTPSNIAHSDRFIQLNQNTQDLMLNQIIYSLIGWAIIALIIRSHIPIIRYISTHFNLPPKEK